MTIATLALGIGANTALFSIFNSLIMRPLPVRDPGSLALLTDGSWSYPVWQEISARADDLFDGAFTWSDESFDLTQGGRPVPVDGAYVSGRFFDVLGVPAFRGRMLTPADDSAAPPNGPVAVVSHRFWRQHFGGADDVVGRQLTVLIQRQRFPFTVVGVMPPGFSGVDVGRMADVMLPFAAEPLLQGRDSALPTAGRSWLEIMVRLKPGQTIEHANAALRGVQPQIRDAVLPGLRGRPGLRRALPHRSADPGAGRGRRLQAAQTVRDTALRNGRRRGTCAARGVREHREPSARACAGAAGRAQRAPGARRVTLAARPAALSRKLPCGDDRCGARAAVREVGQRSSRSAVGHLGENRFAGPRARLAGARVHGDSRMPVCDQRRRRAHVRA